jgi:hypothetical protein
MAIKFLKDVVSLYPKAQNKGNSQLTETGILYDRYGLTVMLSDPQKLDDPDLRIEEVSPTEALPTIRLIREEFSKYPPSYIKWLKINGIRIGRNLRQFSNGVNAPSRAINGGLYFTGRMYLDCNPRLAKLLKTTVHHEPYHRADDREYKLFNRIPLTSDLVYHSWTRLNPVNPEEIRERLLHRFSITDPLIERFPIEGFIQFHGLQHYAEDRAYFAETLMAEPDKAFYLSQRDQTARNKLYEIMKSFERRSRGLMDVNYFRDLLAGKVGFNYWAKSD